MHPILGGLPNEGALVPTSTGVALDGLPTRPDEVIELGQLDNKRIPVILVEWPLFKIFLDEGGF